MIWVQKTVVDTETWTNKTSQIIAVPSVQDDVANKVTSSLFAQINIEQYVQQALPEKAAPLAAPISSGIKGFVEDKTKEVVASDKFAEVWQQANSASHASLINSIEKLNDINSQNTSSDVIFIDQESLMLNLRPVMDEVKSNLVERGVTFLPQNQVINQDKVTFEVAKINNLPQILGAYNLLNSLSYWLPVMAVVFGAAGIFVANNKRRAFAAIVVMSILFAVITVQAVRAGQYSLTQAVAQNSKAISSQSAVAIYEIITNDLVESLRWLMGGMLAIGIFIFLSGPSAAATWLRSKVGGLAKNYKTNKYIKAAAKNSSVIISLIALAVAALIVLGPAGSPVVYIWLIVIAGLISVAILAIKQELES